MKYLVQFLLKILVTFFYSLRILISVLWKFSTNVDYSIENFSWIYKEEDGYYFKNLQDFWKRKTSFSEELKERQENDYGPY